MSAVTPPVRVLSAPRKTAGLNNKKMVLLGLRKIAVETKSQYRMPTHLFDFTPTKEGNGEAMLPLGEVFLEAEVKRAFADAAIDLVPTQQLTNSECLEACARAVVSDRSSREPRTVAGRILSSFKPAEELRLEAERVVSLLPREICAVQLRIERDWLEHVGRKAWTDGPQDGFEIVLRHQRIFDKIAANELVPKNLYICCDEDDLLVKRSEIVADGNARGFEIFFKSDFYSPFKSRLKKSVVDFEICLRLPYYTGLTFSTFSNLLCCVKGYEIQKQPNHFIYDALSEQVERRTDYGRYSNPSAALSPPV